MKKEKIMIVGDLKNKVLLILFVLLVKISFAQKEITVNNDFLKIKLKNVGKNISLQFKNTTNDTIYFRKIFFLEDGTTNSHILSFEKKYDSIIRDTVYEQGFFLYYNVNTKYVLNTPEPIVKIPPKTIREFFLVHLFREGKYFLKIKTFYIHRKKYYYIDNQTNEVKIE
ncbi:hypothetical protein [Capnocytophaga felis]|uniref:Uncharacterized protein n=1 Tax=Capnocytophaga felis TaxID=2267611 RepID=A0A5M4B9E6_9FLAO|nr:hypothetical protein [Capnocytophaga felis]GET46198.1 hypothetical protein RCZ01_15000 [Capnocytophaga felis]GET48989.1 hypothetical protein RCZ02_18200 [Capnocytophaga felis]